MYARPRTQQKPRTAQLKSFPAPVGGWVANRNLAQPNVAQAPQGAAVLRNFFPTATGAIMRRGSEVYSILGDGSLPVAALFSYINGSQEKLFGATDAAIYDVGAVSSPVHAATGGDWSVVQFATQGGTFLRGVNGKDTPFVYDGVTFEQTPALTFGVGETVTPDMLCYVWAYKQRLFFIQKESLDVWYLPVDNIAGELVKLPLGGLFGRGGSLLMGASWSLDAGNQGGLSEQCVFVTTEGEVAVFQGSNPSDASDWSKVGVYRIGKPLGPKAFIRAGGDLVIATSIGFVPLSQAIQRDYAALSPSAVSFPIEVAWNEAVELRAAPWHCEVWPSKQMVVVALPTVNEQEPAMYIANARTGAWAEFTNWSGTCLEVYKERLFFGSSDGKVVEANVTGLDQGATFTATYVPLFDDLRSPASLKITELCRAVFRASVALDVQVSMQVDFQINLPSVPDAPVLPIGDQWGNAIWGEGIWGGSDETKVQQIWQSVPGTGYALAPSVQITSGGVVPLDAELIRIDATYTKADIVT